MMELDIAIKILISEYILILILLAAILGVA